MTKEVALHFLMTPVKKFNSNNYSSNF